ncbi:helix-turn-helix domain-containing protein [Rhodococcus sp. NPDC003318]|uniref:helix-turn-helix domain-containing protein n=1 Tax=Rhodococcus sp. NPDC003318 TaxID=3364503 RepID=UPI00367ABF76
MTVLLREAIGDSLRRTRVAQSRTLREVSSTARVSLGYLSEVERGRKEASSELLAAICDALDVPLSEVLHDVSETLSDSTVTRSEASVPPVETAAQSAVRAGTTSHIDEDTLMVIPGPPAAALAAA